MAGSTPPGNVEGIASSRPLGSQVLPLTLGKFRIERELARGGMGRVVLASLAGAEGFEKPLVLKLIREDLAGDPSFVARFVEEMKASGFIAAALRRHGIEGAAVVPARLGLASK